MVHSVLIHPSFYRQLLGILIPVVNPCRTLGQRLLLPSLKILSELQLRLVVIHPRPENRTVGLLSGSCDLQDSNLQTLIAFTVLHTSSYPSHSGHLTLVKCLVRLCKSSPMPSKCPGKQATPRGFPTLLQPLCKMTGAPIWHKGVGFFFFFPNHFSLPPSQNSSLAKFFKEV